jgi:hypothetical protein
MATTPNWNGTWPLQLHVYVIRAGGTDGSFLLDYQTVDNFTIRVGQTPVPEFPLGDFTAVISIVAVAVIVSTRKGRMKTNCPLR